jgi:hypothetical protein
MVSDAPVALRTAIKFCVCAKHFGTTLSHGCREITYLVLTSKALPSKQMSSPKGQGTDLVSDGSIAPGAVLQLKDVALIE